MWKRGRGACVISGQFLRAERSGAERPRPGPRATGHCRAAAGCDNVQYCNCKARDCTEYNVWYVECAGSAAGFTIVNKRV